MTTQLTRKPTTPWPSPFLTFGKLFDDFIAGGPSEGAMRPAMDVFEDGENLMLQAELPGLAKDDVNITIEDGVLTISGEKKSSFEKTEGNWHRLERRYGAIHRSVSLPTGVDPAKAVAKFDNGVLTVTFPKHEGAKPRKLEIA